MTQRLYDEKEIAAILRAAADESEDGTSGAEVGLSVDELAQIGAESGLDPAAIRRAATRMDAAPSRAVPSSSIWGGPVSHERTWTLDRELTSSEWELVLADIRRAFGIPGVVSVREGAFEWVHKTIDSFTAHVSATVRNGKTTFQVAAGDPVRPTRSHKRYGLGVRRYRTVDIPRRGPFPRLADRCQGPRPPQPPENRRSSCRYGPYA